METELHEGAINAAGDRAGVFEHDSDVAYFYLFDMGAADGQKVQAAIQIMVGSPDFGQQDIAIRWNSTDTIVGLFIRNELWAAFDVEGAKAYGGNYRSGGSAVIPNAIREQFEQAREH